MKPKAKLMAMFIYAALAVAIFILLISGPAKSGTSLVWHPPTPVGNLVEGSKIPLDMFCMSSKDDTTKPSQPSYDRLMKTLQQKEQGKYDILMAKPGVRCIKLSDWGYQKLMGTALNKYETFEGGDFGCIVVWRFSVDLPDGPDEVVFAWATCPKTYKS